MKNSVSFYTLGCRLNQAETATLQTTFERNGYRVVDFKAPAEVVVVNTCTVTENGDSDTRKIVNRIRRMNPEAQVALVGCQAQIQREKLLTLPNVRWVVGNARKMDLANIVNETSGDQAPQVITPVIPRSTFTSPVAGIDRDHTRANLKIQDGCDFFCSFCVIPFARGRARSRLFPDLLSEAKQLIAAGHREIVLTGINLGTYRDGNKTLPDVIDALEKLPGLERVRISSIEPTTIPTRLIRRAGENSNLCRHFHIPLQSGSDKILQAMNRRYSVAEFSDFIRQVNDAVPGVCQGTDVMVGFPGETDVHFDQTYSLLSELPLAYFHVFSYSERPWVKSRKLEPKVVPEIIERRSHILRELSARKRYQYLQAHVGTVETVLFEQQKNGYWNGLTDTYIRVKVKTEGNLKNRLLPVRLVEADNQAMIGTLQ
ncbi:tRNA (N(6)-L-threonylcarbamoyladenosine(37)-C(2))-methylthiotransferase MtaB [candidate division KSB1 bacterium 4484_188]|nr:MAG: tRNA (N(6)-L-threonylcarbamoyladenosine(37)-C(2))-methylthiotransferase MtaB [candidate division KSB1 bacterium 4484_188]